MKKLLKTTITLAAIGVAVKVIDTKLKNSEIKLRSEFDSKLNHLNVAEFKDRRAIKSEKDLKARSCVHIGKNGIVAQCFSTE